MSIRDPMLRAVWEEMVKEGLLVPNGLMRPGYDGKLRPAYVLSEKGKEYFRLLDELKAGRKTQ